jgi:hypothetical protein
MHTCNYGIAKPHGSAEHHMLTFTEDSPHTTNDIHAFPYAVATAFFFYSLQNKKINVLRAHAYFFDPPVMFP